MELKEDLTNEKISSKFVNQFDLCNYAIGIAEDAIKSGREPSPDLNTENIALQVLDAILYEDERSKDEPEEEAFEGSSDEEANEDEAQEVVDQKKEKDAKPEKVLSE